MRGIVPALLGLATVAYSHGNHQGGADVETDWATRHMKEEHHIDTFDAGSFFALHDYDNSGDWSPDEIRKTYGLQDPSNAHVTESQKEALVRDVLSQFDPSGTGEITREEWIRQTQAGKRLPDFGYGPGHHGDIEYEYEIHHFEQFHGEDAKEEDLTHPEDIEHFKLHDELELAEQRLGQLERMQIVDSNIPQKFLRIQ
ncbi:putative secretory pathway protein Ssp120 [Talaromyces proteolyticus]|uniref:Secretory pathway protein Ssp120 n=1 Tax=Talaromyces proteolyticus TaxID=1131652 RepID=A0AAD4Q5Y7_9EURO|nr:putative secretory pathway protein Ssp120 [Talaromyces proteolyticus]KAH8705131.1 putative secretory pathway protein Ssp120 [Talaromyces proteolyticus]